VSGQAPTPDALRAAEAAARHSYGKLVAFLAARSRDVAGAEDALSEAFAAALAHWPLHGVPTVPDAWLLTVARRKLIDAARRRRQADSAAEHLQWLAGLDDGGHDEPVVPDQRLGLLFACAHPAIERSVRAPLMLQAVLGFDAATIASAFLVAPATMSQRLVRAKAKIRRAGISLQVPGRHALAERLDAVLEAIYAAYAEGWADPAGTDARRRNLADEALWLGRLVASLLPEQAEALGLLALMLHAHARRAARRSPQGDYVPLDEQDTAQWDHAMIDEAEALLWQASRCAGAGGGARCQLEAAVQSAHAVRRRTGQADWTAIERLYDALCVLTGSPVAALNRAVAQARTRGAAAGLAALEALAGDPRLADYQPYWAARADLLARSGATAAACQAYQQAIGLERDPAVRRFLQQRAAAVAAVPDRPRRRSDPCST
jgi:RNA polymerase sigma-70 factor (ECF subfamily)